MTENKYCDVNTWVELVEKKAIDITKSSVHYRKIKKKFKVLISVTTLLLILSVLFGYIFHMNITSWVTIITSILEPVLVYLTGLVSGFSVDSYKEIKKEMKSFILYRATILFQLIDEMERNGIITSQVKDKCHDHINNGRAQMENSIDGLKALKDVIQNIINEICF